jgi:hypothetical protein
MWECFTAEYAGKCGEIYHETHEKNEKKKCRSLTANRR